MASKLNKYNHHGGINAVWLHERQYNNRLNEDEDNHCSTNIHITIGGRSINSSTDNFNKKYEAAFKFIKSHSDGSETDSELALKVLEMLK